VSCGIRDIIGTGMRNRSEGIENTVSSQGSPERVVDPANHKLPRSGLGWIGWELPLLSSSTHLSASGSIATEAPFLISRGIELNDLEHISQQTNLGTRKRLGSPSIKGSAKGSGGWCRNHRPAASPGITHSGRKTNEKESQKTNPRATTSGR
jgi:hypothetical protein